MFRVHHSIRNGIGSLYYLFPQQDLSNGLSNGPNRYCMKTLRPQEVEIQTYHFKVHKIVGVSYYRVMFRV